MATIEEIEIAIDRLSREEFLRLMAWLEEREQQAWDRQMDRDSASKKLDFLVEEANQERQAGLLRDWPPVQK